MFDQDKWQEIFATIKKNKLRTFLTMFGIGWGIFMIVILLGAGNALQKGVERDFSAWSTNAGFFWTQRTTISYGGYKPGRRFQFTNADTEYLRKNVAGLGILAPRNRLASWRTANRVNYGTKSSTFNIYGDYPGYFDVQRILITSGRRINQLDIDQKRKTALVGQNVVDVLFGEEDPIGKHIAINNIYFQVIGVFQSRRTGQQGDDDTRTIYTPFTTFQQAFRYGDDVGWFAYTAKAGYKVSDVEAELLQLLRSRHKIHPKDIDAIGSENLEEEYEEITGLFTGIEWFTWFVGISTLLAGIIGISNIMLIIVKERTREIGIRKALGASPASIVSLIIQESVFLTTIGGYVALVAGIYLLELIGQVVPDEGMFGRPEIDITVALGALGILIFGGGLAGILPAYKAVAIHPIEAIRNE